MTLALRLLCRVVKRRLAAGEALETVLANYPRLTEEERESVRGTVSEG